MGDMVGHPIYALDGDLASVRVVSRYARRLAKVAVLRPVDELIREFRAVVGPSFHCRPKLVLDQDGVPFDTDGNPCPHPPPCGSCRVAMVLRLQFWPVRVWLVGWAEDAVRNAPERERVSLARLEPDYRRPTAEALQGVHGHGEPYCIVDVRNRRSVRLQTPLNKRLPDESRRKLRRLLSPHKLNEAGPEVAFLRSRSLYMDEWTSLDDVTAQVAIALVQFGVVDSDSDLSTWLLERYLGSVRLKGVSPQQRFRNGQAVFEGAWKNWSDHDRAGAWLSYLGSWFRNTRQDGAATDPESLSDTDEDRSSDQLGALSPARKRRRVTAYPVPPDEPPDPSGRLSLSRTAGILGLSTRQVRRLMKTGQMHAVATHPLIFAGCDVEALRGRRAAEAEEFARRHRTISRLIAEGKPPDAARKAEYRQRSRRHRGSAVSS